MNNIESCPFCGHEETPDVHLIVCVSCNRTYWPTTRGWMNVEKEMIVDKALEMYNFLLSGTFHKSTPAQKVQKINEFEDFIKAHAEVLEEEDPTGYHEYVLTYTTMEYL